MARFSIQQWLVPIIAIGVPLALTIGFRVYDAKFADGEYFESRKNYKEAAKSYALAAEQPLHKTDAQVLYKLAYCQRRAGDLDAAMATIQKANDFNTAHPQLFSWRCCGQPSLSHQIAAERGWIHYKKGENDKALAAFDQANKSQEAYTAYTGRAAVFEAMKRYPEAEASYDKAVQIASTACNREVAYHERAIYHRDRGQKDLELKALQNALKQEDCSTAYYELGNILYERNDFKGAESSYSQAIRMDQNSERYYHSRGLANRELHNYKQAIADLDSAIQLDPTCKEAATDKENIMKTLVAR
jgi:tetratricopeptide (TPR) repeat protein